MQFAPIPATLWLKVRFRQKSRERGNHKFADIGAVTQETRKAGVLIGLENRDVLRGVGVRSPQSPPTTVNLA